MQKLAFNTPILSRNSTQVEIDHVLMSAASVAEVMPKLRLLQIWHRSILQHQPVSGVDGDFCVFSYMMSHHQPQINWLSTWKGAPTLTSWVITAWDKAASEHTHRHVSVDILPPTDIAPSLEN